MVTSPRILSITGRADPHRRPHVAHHRGLPARPGHAVAKPAPTDLVAVRDFMRRSRDRPTAVDLFCGAGGLSRGLERAGFDVLVGADSDPWAVRTHDANLAGLSWCGDLADPTEFIHTLRVWGIETVDLVAGGVPCQPFSRAGRSRIRELVESGERGDHDVRADLWGSFITVVEALAPSAVVVENVPDLPSWDDGAVLIGLYESLRQLGYRVEARILDGFRYGVPQHRQRLILIGLTGGRQPTWPMPETSRVTLREAIGDLPPIPRAQRAERLPYDSRRQSSEFQQRMRRDVPDADSDVILEHICRDVRPDDMQAFRLLGEGQTYIDLPEELRRYRSDVFTDKYKRLVWDELCRSITAHISKDGYWYIHPDQHRTLSIREAARVQSFPDDFRFAGTPTHRYRQIGNAVPMLLGEAIGHTMREALDRPVKPVRSGAQTDEFRRLLLDWHLASGVESPSWRRGDDPPWLVLLGELLLQRMKRTAAERAMTALRALAPTPAALLAVDDPDAALAAIGIKERGRLALQIAKDLVDYFGGEVPGDETELMLLPGVGDYVGRAVLTFGFGRRQVLVDRTTARVAGRIARHDDTRRFQLRLDLHHLAGALGPDADFSRALLDLGREICRVQTPLCAQCPVARRCAKGRQVDEQLNLASMGTPEDIAA
jgi:DNA (cytosine-5)-methyltransferase 1